MRYPFLKTQYGLSHLKNINEISRIVFVHWVFLLLKPLNHN